MHYSVDSQSFPPLVFMSFIYADYKPLIEIKCIISGTPTAAPNPGFPGQPTNLFLDLTSEKVTLQPSPGQLMEPKWSRRNRREIVDLLPSFTNNSKTSLETAYPNITETELLQLLINLSRNKEKSMSPSDLQDSHYYVDSLEPGVRESLSADQYEILKIVEKIGKDSGRGIVSQVIACVTSLSFIRCAGIFIWPLLSNSLLSFAPSLPIIGRSDDTYSNDKIQMLESNFEEELLQRAEKTEKNLKHWYQSLVDGKFSYNAGMFNVKGNGNGELGISYIGNTRGERAIKVKNHKNLPSILTIFSDIMADIIDQKPPPVKAEVKKSRSLKDILYASPNLVVDNEKRSSNNDKVVNILTSKCKYKTPEDEAYQAFEVLFGTKLNDRLVKNLTSFCLETLKTFIKSLTDSPDDIREIPLDTKVSYEVEDEVAEESLLNPENKKLYTSKLERSSASKKNFKDHVKGRLLETVQKDDAETNDKEDLSRDEASSRKADSGLSIKLPTLDEEILPRKATEALMNMGRDTKVSVNQLAPAVGYLISFFVQMFLAHARAAASVAGMLSNMAMASAVFSMMRQTLFGQTSNPKVKYIYDNDKFGPGITWPMKSHEAAYHSYYKK